MRPLALASLITTSVLASLGCCCAVPAPQGGGAPAVPVVKAKPNPADPVAPAANPAADPPAAKPTAVAGSKPFRWEDMAVDPSFDDIPEFLSRYRDPDTIRNTESKPASQTFKALDYVKEGVAVSFTPNVPDRENAKPPYERWVLTNYYDLKSDKLIDLKTARNRMASAARPGSPGIIWPLANRLTPDAPAKPTKPAPPEERVTRENYNSLRNGDTLAHAQDVLGPGTEAAQSGGFQVVTWQSRAKFLQQPTIISMSFQNGQLVAKSIIGP